MMNRRRSRVTAVYFNFIYIFILREQTYNVIHEEVEEETNGVT